MTVHDIIDNWRTEIKKMHDEIDNRKKDFGRSYLPHVGSFFKTLDYFSRIILPRIPETVGDVPNEDLNQIIETRFRTIYEMYKFLIYKSENRNKEEDMLLETIVIDVATSINYFGCTPLVITSKTIDTAKTYPIIIKEKRDSRDPIIIIVNPKLVKNFILTPIIGHEIAHLLLTEYKNIREKNYIQELFCDYLASIIFGVAFLQAALVNISNKTKFNIYDLSDFKHPPMEYRISGIVMYLENKIEKKVDANIKKALELLIKEWNSYIQKNPKPSDYNSDLSSLKINQLNTVAKNRVDGVIKENDIDWKNLVHNKHIKECPLSIIHNNSIKFILEKKEIKNIKTKLIDYSKK